MLRNLKAYKFTIGLTVLIFILSSIPGNQLPTFSFNAADKVEHFLAYGTLCFVWLVEKARALRWSSRSGRWLIRIVAASIMYGLVLEILQGLVFYHRTFDYADILANTVGALLGMLIFRLSFGSLKKILNK
ncbi:MAG: VanZ family protein [Bacteroidia bacterium]|jgi:VanZ family protein